MRADQLLVQQGLAPTRSVAQRLIAGGAVRWRSGAEWSVLRKAGEDVPGDCTLEITDDAELRFASRGGLKLEAALAHCHIDVSGRLCLDAGQGTGGFTDALLQRGAAKVVGIDVGHGQLSAAMASDARVQAYEGINARDVTGSTFEAEFPAGSFDLVSADLSFISLTHALPTLCHYLSPQGDLLALVKPQFELQPAQIGKGGIVRDKALFQDVETRIRSWFRARPMKVHAYFQSPVAGGSGNTEFFVWARHALAGTPAAQDAR